MVDDVQPVLHWIYTGLRESAAMVWMTWWPLVLGFTLSGFVQSFLPRDALRERLGSTSPRSSSSRVTTPRAPAAPEIPSAA